MPTTHKDPSPQPKKWEELLASSPAQYADLLPIFARGIIATRVIKALVWGLLSILNYAGMVFYPLFRYFAADASPRLLWMLVPGLLLAVILATAAPTGE